MYAVIDIHDTISDFISSWLQSYNSKWKDNLKKKQILNWNVTNFTKQESGEQIFDLLKFPRIYKRMKPLPFALDGVNALRNIGFEIVYATACEPTVANDNFSWLKENNFWKKGDHTIFTSSKFLIWADLLIDDGIHNCEKFKGHSILMNQPWNSLLEFPNRISSWKEIIDDIDKYKEWKNGNRT